MPIEVKVCRKNLRRGPIRRERLFLQITDGFQKWREYLPFLLTGGKEDKIMLNEATALARVRTMAYSGMEARRDEILSLQEKCAEITMIQ